MPTLPNPNRGEPGNLAPENLVPRNWAENNLRRHIELLGPDFRPAGPLSEQRVSPYGVYDIAQNEAWVSVGTEIRLCFCRREHPALVARPGALPERHSAADNETPLVAPGVVNLKPGQVLEELEAWHDSLKPRHGLCIDARCAPCRVHEEAIKEHVLLLEQARHRN